MKFLSLTKYTEINAWYVECQASKGLEIENTTSMNYYFIKLRYSSSVPKFFFK